MKFLMKVHSVGPHVAKEMVTRKDGTKSEADVKGTAVELVGDGIGTVKVVLPQSYDEMATARALAGLAPLKSKGAIDVKIGDEWELVLTPKGGAE